MQQNSLLDQAHHNLLPLSHPVIGRRIAKSNIHINICKQYSVSSFIHINRLSSTGNVPFELKQSTHFIQPQIRERIEILQQAVYRTQSFFQR